MSILSILLVESSLLLQLGSSKARDRVVQKTPPSTTARVQGKVIQSQPP